MFLSANIVLSIEARLKAPCHSTDVLLDSRVHLGEVLVQFPGGMMLHDSKLRNFVFLHS